MKGWAMKTRKFLAAGLLSLLVISGCAKEPSPNFQTAYYRNQFQEWLPLAKEGFAPAQYKIGTFYQIPAGVPEDNAEAAKWYRLAAEQGHARAQYSLAILYGAGTGVPRDYEMAYVWYSLAAARLPDGSERKRAFELLSALQQYMTREQLFAAQKRAREWQPGKPESRADEKASASARVAVGSIGTAFIVSPQGHLITNDHVIEGCGQVYAVMPESKFAAKIMARDPKNDLAVLKITGAMASVAIFRTAPSIRAGESVVVVGYPLRGSGLIATQANITTGTVSALAGPQNDARVLQITAPVQPGNSGGPLLDHSGNVIGIVFGKLDALAVANAASFIPENINFALNGRIIQTFLDSIGLKYQTATSEAKLEPADIGARAKGFTVAVECSLS